MIMIGINGGGSTNGVGTSDGSNRKVIRKKHIGL